MADNQKLRVSDVLDRTVRRHGPRPALRVKRNGAWQTFTWGEYHRQVRRNGLEAPDLAITFYGLTEFRLEDPDGNRLWIGQSTSEEPSTPAG